MRALKVLLWIGGVLCLLSVVGMFLPAGMLEAMAARFGLEALPDSPAFLYAVRVISATYVVIGAFLVILARDPARYGTLVPFTGAAAVFLSVACAAFGLTSRMPFVWFLGDAISLGAFGLLVLLLWKRAAASL